MSQIAPDLPELRAIPEAARGIVYISAMSAAIRSPPILMAGVSLLLLAAGIGGTQGHRLFGITGGLAGAILGAGAATVLFFKILLPWRARQLIPELLRQTDPRSFDHLARADDAIGRMIDEYKRREMPGAPPSPDDNSGTASYQAGAFSSRRTLPRGSAHVVHCQRLHGARGRIAAPAVAHRNQAARAEASACLTRVLLDFRSGGARPARYTVLGLDDLDISAGCHVADSPEQQRPSNQRKTDDDDQPAIPRKHD